MEVAKDIGPVKIKITSKVLWYPNDPLSLAVNIL